MSEAPTELLGKSLEIAKDYADAIVKGPLEQFGGILSDSIGYWRLKNQVNIILKAKAYLEKKGIVVEKILPDIFVPLLTEAANVSDETIQDMFARLLAELLEPKWKTRVHPSFAKAIAEITPTEAWLLKRAFERDPHHSWDAHVGDLEAYKTLEQDQIKAFKEALMHLDYPTQFFYLENLCRLGIIKSNGKDEYYITKYGFQFCSVCLPNPKST